jgi:hypothetical protein
MTLDASQRQLGSPIKHPESKLSDGYRLKAFDCSGIR